jgi:hypothetical protein
MRSCLCGSDLVAVFFVLQKKYWASLNSASIILDMVPKPWNAPWPLGVVLFGLLMLLLAVIGTFTGKTYGRGGSAIRAKNPFNYWLTLVMQYLAGVVSILYGLYLLPY